MDEPQCLYLNDPIQNLKVRVLLNCVVPALSSEETSTKSPRVTSNKDAFNSKKNELQEAHDTRNSWNAVFRWQEKKFGPRELESYLSTLHEKKSILERSAVESEYCTLLRQKLDAGEDVLDNISQVMLFTYTDKDQFVPKNDLLENVTTSDNMKLNEMAASIASIPKTGGYRIGGSGDEGRSTNAGKMIFRETPFKIFYIMAAVDVDTDRLHQLRMALKKNEVNSHQQKNKSPGQYYEVVLCTIKTTTDGKLMEIKPAISGQDLLLMSDCAQGSETAESDITYTQFRTPDGSLYQYALVHESERPTPEKQKQMRYLDRQVFTKQLEFLEHRIENNLFPKVEKSFTTIFHFGIEIVSAEDFGEAFAKDLYVQYELVLPDTSRWQWLKSSHPDHTFHDPKNSDSNYPLRGVTQKCRQRYVSTYFGSDETIDLHQKIDKLAENVPLRKIPVAHYCFPLDVILQYTGDSTYTHQDLMPKLFLHVKSIDIWRRHRSEGYAFLDFPRAAGLFDKRLKTWKVAGSLRQKSAEFFLGGALNLENSHQMHIPDGHSGPFLNRYGLKTETAGALRIRVNSALHRYVSPSFTVSMNARERTHRLHGYTSPTNHWRENETYRDITNNVGYHQRRHSVAATLQTWRSQNKKPHDKQSRAMIHIDAHRRASTFD